MRKLEKTCFYGILAGFALAAPASLWAQSTCVEPAGTAFTVTTLVTPTSNATSGLTEDAYSGAMQMGIANDGRIFIPKMKSGELRVYKPGSAVTSLVGKVPTYFNAEDGMLGIALDPHFSTTHWIYLFYSDTGTGSSPNRRELLSRFTLDTTLGTSGLGQLTNRKILLAFPRESNDFHHAGGGMAFDSNGVLVLGAGDNTNQTTTSVNGGYGPIHYFTPSTDAQRSSANTNDLRGKILRIKPIAFADDQNPAPGVGSTYEIPVGNLWETINNPTFNPGWDATDTLAKVRREIYVMGLRNPWRPKVDTRSGWIFWGEPGPDADVTSATRGPAGHDEWNLALRAGFFGHPYCNGYNVPYNTITAMSGTGTATYGPLYNCAATVNNSPNNTGIHHLPPAVPAVAAYSSGNSTDDDPRFNTTYSTTTISHATETAVGGPMYRYNPALNSPGKFPPYYEGRIFFFDYARRTLRIISHNPDGTLPAGSAGVENFAPGGLTSFSMADLQFGPDGFLYLLKTVDAYQSLGTGPGLYRITYNGTYDDTCYHRFEATVQGPGAGVVGLAAQARPLQKNLTSVLNNGFLTVPAGYRTADVYNAAGRKVWSFHRAEAEQASDVRLPAELAMGILRVRLLP